VHNGEFVFGILNTVLAFVSGDRYGLYTMRNKCSAWWTGWPHGRQSVL